MTRWQLCRMSQKISKMSSNRTISSPWSNSVSVSNIAILGIQVPKWTTSIGLRQFVKSIVGAVGGYREAAPLLGISPNIVWNLIHDEQQDSPTLRKRWAIRKTPSRNRVWMRTDNLDKAVATLLKHYPEIKSLEYYEDG